MFRHLAWGSITAGLGRAMSVSVHCQRNRRESARVSRVEEHSLVPLAEARLGCIGLDERLSRSQTKA